MKPSNHSIAYRPTSPQALADILKTGCWCGHSYTVRSFHVGGHGKQPFLVCMNPVGGETHYRMPISERVYWEWRDLTRISRQMLREVA